MGRTTIKALLTILILGAFAQANPFFFGQNATLGASVSDNFDSYANGALLESQTAWSSLNGSIIIDKPASDGRVRGNILANNLLRRTLPVFAANHEAEITLVIGDGNGAIGPAVRVQSTADAYSFHWDDAANRVYLAYLSGGGWHEITSVGSKTYVTGNKLRLEATGVGSATRLTAKEDTGSGWVAVFTAVDPGVYYDGGQPGIYAYYDTSTYLHGDNWTASDL